MHVIAVKTVWRRGASNNIYVELFNSRSISGEVCMNPIMDCWQETWYKCARRKHIDAACSVLIRRASSCLNYYEIARPRNDASTSLTATVVLPAVCRVALCSTRSLADVLDLLWAYLSAFDWATLCNTGVRGWHWRSAWTAVRVSCVADSRWRFKLSGRMSGRHISCKKSFHATGWFNACCRQHSPQSFSGPVYHACRSVRRDLTNRSATVFGSSIHSRSCQCLPLPRVSASSSSALLACTWYRSARRRSRMIETWRCMALWCWLGFYVSWHNSA